MLLSSLSYEVALEAALDAALETVLDAALECPFLKGDVGLDVVLRSFLFLSIPFSVIRLASSSVEYLGFSKGLMSCIIATLMMCDRVIFPLTCAGDSSTHSSCSGSSWMRVTVPLIVGMFSKLCDFHWLVDHFPKCLDVL